MIIKIKAIWRVKSVIYTGRINFFLFIKHLKFYVTYKLINVENHTIYSDKFRIFVLNLNYIHLVAQEEQDVFERVYGFGYRYSEGKR